MDYEKLKEVIAKQIKENGQREITGPVLQAVLMAMVDSLGEVYPHTYTDEEKAQARANIDALSNHNGEITKEKLSLEVQAILNDVANKQNISDATLATIAKTIVGAINEVYKGGLEDASIATSKIKDGAVTDAKIANGAVTTPKIANDAVTTEKVNDGAITEPKLDTDLVNIITSAVQPTELASAIATALTSYVAKADIVDTTGSATDKVMSQHGVTEAIDGVTNKVTELESQVYKEIKSGGVSYDPSLIYDRQNIGWTASNFADVADRHQIIRNIRFFAYGTTVNIAQVTINENKVITAIERIKSYSTTAHSWNSIDEEYTLSPGQILLFRYIGFSDAENPTSTLWYNGELSVGTTMGTYALWAPISYDIYTQSSELWDNIDGINNNIVGINKEVFPTKFDSITMTSSVLYVDNNIGWTGANGATIFDKRVVLKNIVVVTHKASMTQFGGKISLAIVKVENNIISNVRYLPEIGSDGNLKTQNLNISVLLNPNEVLLIKGIGFNSAGTQHVYFSASINVGETLTTYPMFAPISYEICDFEQSQILWPQIFGAYAEINVIKDKIAQLPTKDFSNLKYAALGDSITDNEISAIGTLLGQSLGTQIIGNFARGNATFCDYSQGGVNVSPIDLSYPENEETPNNVISNQVRRLLQWTTPEGEQIRWTHPIDGEFLIPTEYGVGLGHVDDIPNIIYIAAGTNDTKNQASRVIDNCETIFAQTYSELDRITMASAIRWAIETLMSAYPNAQIFVASPLQTNRGWNWVSGTYKGLRTSYLWEERPIFEKLCAFESVNYIDSFAKSGFNNLIAQNVNDGIHPTGTWRANIVKFLDNFIRENYIFR